MNINYYIEIKDKLINNEVYKSVKDYSKNRSDLTTYYEVGKLLALAGKHYGEGVIKEYSKKLTSELGKGYNLSSLKRMRQFYLIIRKGATLSHQLSWSHYIELITVNYVNKINYYIRITEQNNLSVRELNKSDIGQIEIYMNYIDKNLKKIDMDKTIGIII